jgi:hypothetical protein
VAFTKLAVLDAAQQVQDVFSGVNRNLRIGGNELHDTHNLTGEEYPVLSTRKRRGFGAKVEKPGGLITKDAIAVVDGSKLIYNGHEIDMELSEGEKQLVSMGAYLLVWPDKKWLNTQALSEYGRMENETKTTGDVEAVLCAQDGAPYEDFVISATAPTNGEDGDLWMDISGETPGLYRYEENSGMWVGIATVYVKLSAAGIGKGFAQYDGVTISGLTADLEKLNGSHVLQAVEDDAITIIGIMKGTGYVEKNAVTVERKVPELDFVTECGNRVWGCKYGVVNGKPINEIYASKLGDFKNWNVFQGLSTDSFVASRGSDGVFTGAITHQGHPLFFKEDCIEKVYPSSSGAHQIVTTECRGVQKGCWRSLVIVEETVYYKSRVDVCAYNGSLPVSVSEALGEARYSNARAGAEGGLYYISMQDEQGAWSLMAYDTQRRMWHREDDTHAMMFTTCDGRLWWIDEDKKQLVCRVAYGLEEEGAFAWKADSGIIGFSQVGNKYVSRFTVRAELEKGSSIYMEMKVDDEPWKRVINYARPGLKSFNIPVRPKRCDHLQLRFGGIGDCRIYSISKHLREGSERNW